MFNGETVKLWLKRWIDFIAKNSAKQDLAKVVRFQSHNGHRNNEPDDTTGKLFNVVRRVPESFRTQYWSTEQTVF